jgi:carbamoyltransferase
LSITVLGISAYYHGSAAAVQEKRFTRKKYDAGFPANAIRYCVSQAGGFEHVDYVVFYDKPLVKFERLLET